ncbi:MAG: PulJ/GspJ family protein [Limisphaerales bacterium]
MTILEMLVATTLLVVIVLGLTAMFVQTQKAFRGGHTQTDVMESGRTVVDMMARDFQQMSDAKDGNIVNFFYGYKYAWNQDDGQGNYRTNYLSDAFTIEHINTTWFGVGYAVSNTVNGGANGGTPLVGALYRYLYTTNDSPTENPHNLFTNLTLNGSYTPNFYRIIDGVIHMRLRAFDASGTEITNNVDPTTLTLPRDQPTHTIPNSIEIELGILEPQVLEQVRALGTNVQAQQTFLTNRMGAVHIFRQQIPVRTALPR